MEVIKNIISIPFNCAEQNSYLKILIRYVLRIDVGGGGTCCAPITFE